MGNAVVAWTQHPTGSVEGDIWVRRFASAWTAATQLSAPDAESVHAPWLAADRCGNVLAVWSQSGGPTAFDSVWTSHYVPAGGWSAGSAVDSVGYDLDPAVASNAAGQALLAFELYGGGVSSLWANRYQ
jgi:hypothetical protein